MAVLPFLLAPTTSGAFEFNGFAAGLGLSGHAVEVKGYETDEDGTKGAGITDNVVLESASIFGEARFNIQDRVGLTVGVSLIPGSHQFVTESKFDYDLIDKDSSANTGTSTVTGQIENLMSVYIQPTVRVTDVFSVYLTAGMSTMDVDVDADLVTSTNFNKTATSDGTHFGAGIMAENANGFFVKVEGNASDYDSVTFTTSDSTTAKASLDEESVSLLLGKAF